MLILRTVKAITKRGTLLCTIIFSLTSHRNKIVIIFSWYYRENKGFPKTKYSASNLYNLKHL